MHALEGQFISVASEIKWLICYVTLSWCLSERTSRGPCADVLHSVCQDNPGHSSCCAASEAAPRLVTFAEQAEGCAASLTCSEDSHAEVVLLNLPRSAAEHAESSATSLLSLLPRASARFPVHLSRLKLLSSPYRAEDSAVSLQCCRGQLRDTCGRMCVPQKRLSQKKRYNDTT